MRDAFGGRTRRGVHSDGRSTRVVAVKTFAPVGEVLHPIERTEHERKLRRHDRIAVLAGVEPVVAFYFKPLMVDADAGNGANPGRPRNDVQT